MLWDEVSPSPEAVTEMVKSPRSARGETARYRVTAFVLTLETAAMGLADHWADTPEGRPLTEKAMPPLNEPPVVAVRLSVEKLPADIATELDAAESESAGG